MRPVSIALPCLVTALCIAGCATERLDASAPSGVNLSGEWKFDPNLSDDPDKLAEPDKTPERAPGGHRGHGGGRGGGGGMPPMGSPGGSGGVYNFAPTTDRFAPAARGFETSADGFEPAPGASGFSPAAGGLLPVALTAPGIEQAAPLPAAGAPASSTNTRAPQTSSRGVSINRLLKAPVHMSITQKESTVIIKANMPDGTQTADEYSAGKQTAIPYGKDGTADRSVGWRGPVFVVTTTVKKGGWREDDFALDDDGRLIMTTQTKGGRLGKLEIKRVYDRVRGGQSQ
jgi:hypothetical protein